MVISAPGGVGVVGGLFAARRQPEVHAAAHQQQHEEHQRHPDEGLGPVTVLVVLGVVIGLVVVAGLLARILLVGLALVCGLAPGVVAVLVVVLQGLSVRRLVATVVPLVFSHPASGANPAIAPALTDRFGQFAMAVPARQCRPPASGIGRDQARVSPCVRTSRAYSPPCAISSA